MIKAWHPEPATVTFTVACWAFLTAFSFWASDPELFAHPTFFFVRMLEIPQKAWAMGLLLNGLFLIASINTRALPFRATVALISAILWIGLGISTCAAGYFVGILPPFGLWSVFCGFSCLHAVSQWAFYNDR